MRLVVEYAIGDGYTYSAMRTVPVEYESAEAFFVEFEEACQEAMKKEWRNGFMFAGKEWDATDFFSEGDYYPPQILTVDEWFARPY